MSKKINQTFQELKKALEKYKKAKKVQINYKKPIEVVCGNIKLKSNETSFEIEYKGSCVNNNSLEEVIIMFIEKFLTTAFSANLKERNYLIRQLLEERGSFIFKSIPQLEYFWNDDDHTLFFRNQQGNILYKINNISEEKLKIFIKERTETILKSLIT